MSPIGETLRRERLKRNLNLDQISRELKISSRFLEAIEEERFDKLPAGVFARSFVRQYADLLGLDADELSSALQHTLPAPPSLANAEAPQSQPARGFAPDIRVPRVEEWEAVGGRRNWSSSLPAFAMVIVVMLICSGVYTFWQRARHAAPVHEAVAAAPGTPAQQKAEAPAPVGPAAQPAAPPAPQAPPPADTTTAPSSAPPPAAAPAHPDNTSADRPAAENGEAPAAALPAPAAPKGPVHVELTAAEPVWVLARANGKYLFSGTLEANQTRTADANGVLTLRLGNAGGVNITLNGKPIGPVGPKGQVRDVQLTSGGFQIVVAPKPPLPPPADPR